MAQAKFEDFLAEDAVSRLTRDFTRRLTANIQSQTRNYFNQAHRAGLSDHPLRQPAAALGSLLAAAVEPLTPMHLSQVPAARTGRQRPTRADKAALWCNYRDADLLLDLARIGLSLDSGRKTDVIRAAWNAALEPVSNIDRNAYAWTEFGARISLLVIQPYSNDPDFAEAWDTGEEKKLNATVRKVMGKSLDILSTWPLPRNMQVIAGNSAGSDFEFCPVIYFAGAMADIS